MSTQELIGKVRELKELKLMADELGQEITAIEDVIKAHMGENEGIRAGGYKVSYKSVKSVRLDAKSLKAELPDIAERYTVASEYRRFIVA